MNPPNTGVRTPVRSQAWDKPRVNKIAPYATRLRYDKDLYRAEARPKDEAPNPPPSVVGEDPVPAALWISMRTTLSDGTKGIFDRNFFRWVYTQEPPAKAEAAGAELNLPVRKNSKAPHDPV